MSRTKAFTEGQTNMQQKGDAPVKRRALEKQGAGEIVNEAPAPNPFVRDGGDGCGVADKTALIAAIQAARRAIHDRELALLEEFNRGHSVASLAEAIAARLGRKTRSEDLIAEAGLAAAPRDAPGRDGRAHAAVRLIKRRTKLG